MKKGRVWLDEGLLVVRLLVGFSVLAFHGWGKITGGPERWEGIGAHMGNLGITFAAPFWGFCAAASESVGSLLLMLGVLFRPAAAALAFTMAVAMTRHLSLPADAPASGWDGASHAMELFGVYVALLLAGPGKYRVPLGRG